MQVLRSQLPFLAHIETLIWPLFSPVNLTKIGAHVVLMSCPSSYCHSVHKIELKLTTSPPEIFCRGEDAGSFRLHSFHSRINELFGRENVKYNLHTSWVVTDIQNGRYYLYIHLMFILLLLNSCNGLIAE